MKPYSKYFEKIRIRPDPDAELKSRAPRCQWEGCSEAGTHRAPVGRLAEGEYFRFCFNHVREYNKSFNYFSGLGDGEIARLRTFEYIGNIRRRTLEIAGHTRAVPQKAARLHIVPRYVNGWQPASRGKGDDGFAVDAHHGIREHDHATDFGLLDR